MSYSTSFSQWWASGRDSAVEAQKAVLSFLPFFPASDEKRIATVNLVKLSGKNRVINELEIKRGDEPVERTLVMIHGYGAGLGLFYRYLFLNKDVLTCRNFDGLSSVPGTRLYALDLLGMGNSSRPHFHIKSKDPESKIDEAEAFFIDALEEWRKEKKIDKMVLLVHCSVRPRLIIGTFSWRISERQLLFEIPISCRETHPRLSRRRPQ